MKCGAPMQVSAIGREAGPSRAARVGFLVTNLARPAENVIAFYNKRGTCEQWIKEGKGAIKWTRLSCRSFAANAVRLQLHARLFQQDINVGFQIRVVWLAGVGKLFALCHARQPFRLRGCGLRSAYQLVYPHLYFAPWVPPSFGQCG